MAPSLHSTLRHSWMAAGIAAIGVASVLYTGALQTVTYKVPHYRFEGLRVFTNKPPCGPKRGHGTPQPRFALEVHLDKIAEDLGLTPVQIRRPHLVTPFSMTVNHLRITSCGLRGLYRCGRATLRVPGQSWALAVRSRHRAGMQFLSEWCWLAHLLQRHAACRRDDPD